MMQEDHLDKHQNGQQMCSFLSYNRQFEVTMSPKTYKIIGKGVPDEMIYF